MSIRETSMPRAAQTFVEFVQLLRQNSFSVAPDQTASFIEAIGLLGPRGLEDIRRAGLAMLSIPRARWEEYDALFRAFFLDQTTSAPALGDDDDEVEAFDPRDGEQEIAVDQRDSEVGDRATRLETLSQREFLTLSDDEVLRHFAQNARRALPRRKSRRRKPTPQGDRIDQRRTLRQAVQREGEVFDLRKTSRQKRQRPIVLLIDVSGSMKDQSEQTVRLAHAVVQVADRAEVFTLGTRLTRIAPALRDKNIDRALQDVAGVVSDFDGGTRIGAAVAALLAVPRFAGTLRGAAVSVISDGLERGETGTMVDAVARISRMAWRLDWLSPLAADPLYEPRTEALAASLTYFDSLSDGSSIAALADHILSLSRAATRRLVA
ncbi:MAG: VWA domain-containing protein [Pseudomonadota bacterium]